MEIIKDNNQWNFGKCSFQGMVFDLEKGSTLHIDLAKSNSRSKRLRAGSLYLELHFLFSACLSCSPWFGG